MPTLSIPWVNDGEPFDITRDHLTPGAVRRAKVRRIHILKDSLGGLGDLDAADRDLVRDEALEEAQLEEVMVLIHGFLRNIDPSLDLSPEEVLDRLTVDELRALGEALQDEVDDDLADDVDAGEAADPLA